MNQPPDDAISGYHRVSTRRPNSAARRRKVRPFLEFLERREVLSPFTWTGGANDGNWDSTGNWADGSVPKTGLADIVLPSTAQNQTISLQSDDSNLQITSLTMEGGTYTLQGPSSNANQQLSLAPGASLDIENGGTLNVCASSSPNSLALNFLGSTTKTGTGILTLNNASDTYSGNPSSLLVFDISSGLTTIGNTSSLTKSLIQDGAGLLISDGVTASIGSLTGSGSVQLGLFGNQTSSTVLSLNTPQGETDQFTGSVLGPGGTISMVGAGNLTIDNINPANAGTFTVNVQSGSLSVPGTLNAQQLNVTPASGQTATLGGPTIANIVQTNFNSGATFSAALNGTAQYQYTQITATGTTNPINLGGSTLALSLGYTPAVGDTFTIISSAHGITGQFGNVANGQTITVNGHPFLVNYTATAVTLTAQAALVNPAPVLSTSTSLTSTNYALYVGQAISLMANVQAAGAAVPAGAGTVTFVSGGVNLGTSAVGSGGNAVLTTSALPVGSDSVVAYYNGTSSYKASASNTISEAVQKYPTTTSLALTSQRVKKKLTYYMTATVRSQVSGSPQLFGTVVFEKNGAVIGSASIVNGVAQVSIGRTAPKKGSFVAIFQANGTLASSTSNTLTYGKKPKPKK